MIVFVTIPQPEGVLMEKLEVKNLDPKGLYGRCWSANTTPGQVGSKRYY